MCDLDNLTAINFAWPEKRRDPAATKSKAKVKSKVKSKVKKQSQKQSQKRKSKAKVKSESQKRKSKAKVKSESQKRKSKAKSKAKVKRTGLKTRHYNGRYRGESDAKRQNSKEHRLKSVLPKLRFRGGLDQWAVGTADHFVQTFAGRDHGVDGIFLLHAEID
jgi:hypothetical protein